MLKFSSIATVTGAIFLALIVALLAVWLWVLSSPNPLGNQASAWLPWPVACSTRGCITTQTWHSLHRAQTSFANSSQTEKPTVKQSLTTAIRQFLVLHGSVKDLVTNPEIERYRVEVLNLTDEEKVLETTSLTLAEYEEYVLRPYLTQEALRQQIRAESPAELFTQLAQERWIAVLPFSFSWNAEQAIVE